MMADNTGIEWTDATWNPTRGCSRVSEGCRFCYAERDGARFTKPGQPYHGFIDPERSGSKFTGRVELIEHMLDLPLRWKKPRRIFVNSMSDLFHEALPDEAIDRVFAVMALCPQHTFQVLTKRPARMRQYLSMARAHPVGLAALDLTIQQLAKHPRSDTGNGIMLQGDIAHLKSWPLPNVWAGASVEDQPRADERIPQLLATRAAVHYISAEPLLGPIDLDRIDIDGHREVFPLIGTPECEDDDGNPMPDAPALDWVIAGGESGPNARPMHPDWARALRDQCQAAGVPFFFKQWGEYLPEDEAFDRSLKVLETGPPANGFSFRVGKKAAGYLLDGRTHQEFPR
jgi:protein gp37